MIDFASKKFLKILEIKISYVSLNKKETLFDVKNNNLISFFLHNRNISPPFLIFLNFGNIISLYKRIMRYIYRKRKKKRKEKFSFIPVYSSKLITIFNVKLKVRRHNRGIGVA